MSNVLTTSDLLAFNIPDIDCIPVLQEKIGYDQLLTKCKIPLNQHSFIYYKNRPIEPLLHITHNENTVDTLNTNGLHIYLYEPLCYKPSNVEWYSEGFYHEFENTDDQILISEELESIKEYVIRNNLTNVIVHTCDYGVEKYFKNYLSYMKLLCDDLFIRQLTFEKIYKLPNKIKFNKKFICTNWRYTKHRHIAVSYLIDRPSHLSWYFYLEMKHLKNRIWFNLDEWKTKYPKIYTQINSGVEKINESGVIWLDTALSFPVAADPYIAGSTYPIDTMSPDNICLATQNARDNNLARFYDDSFCEIVTESRFAQPTGNFSEKTLRSILYKKPFILMAPPHTLEHLKSYGFKTFSNFWDESYDKIENHEERLLAILELIDIIDEYSLSELEEVYQEMLPILEHNFKVFSQEHKFLRWVRHRYG